MNRNTLLVMLLLPAVVSAAPDPVPPATAPDSGILRWKNGETVSGEIAAASGTSLTWKTSLFEDPLELKWDVLDRIDWSREPVSITAPFSIALRDGSFIYGDLVSIGTDSVSIHSARHGDATLKRSEVLNVRRLHRGNLLYAGPQGDMGWQPETDQQNGVLYRNTNASDSSLATGPAGALLIRAWNRSAILDVKLPDLVDIEFRLHTSKRPDFALVLKGVLKDALRVETWDDELVLTEGYQFKVIRKIEENEREVALRVYWNQNTGKCSVFTPAGELLTTWQVPDKSTDSPPGLILENRGLDLTLDFLRVRTWDGKPPPKFDARQPHVELADGRSIAGEIEAGAPGFIKVQSPGQAAAVDFALGDVDALLLSSDEPQSTDHDMTLSYADGSIVLGHLVSIANGRAALSTSFTKEPFMSQMTLLRQLLIHVPEPRNATPEPALDAQDKIVIQDTMLHGKLETAGDDQPRWMPVGGIKAVRPSKTLVSEMTRAFAPDAVLPATPALFYLTSGDVLSGTLRSLDKTGAEFESELMEARKLPADELEAIQFDASSRSNVQGFDDPAWTIVKGDEKSVRRTNGSLMMDPGTALACPSLMQSSEIKFKYSSTGFSGTRLRLFCEGTNGTHSMNLLLGNTGNQFIVGTESTAGQMDNQVQQQIKPGEPVAVRLEIGDDQIQIFVNDVPLQQFPIDASKCAGSGVIIEPAGMWGNQTFPITLSDFSSKSVPGRIWLPEVSSDVKTQVLTVPRFQKDDPPRHVLLAANGDVLRGEIEAATDSHLAFRCGMENLDVPRDRVKAVIWLTPADAHSPATPAASAAPDPLNYRLGQRMGFSQIGLANLISILQGQDGALKIRLPEKEDPRRVQMQFGNESVGEALQQICYLFDLHYRRAEDGTIILESNGQQTAGDLAGKTYWLKPDAIPDTPPVQQILTAKGVTFPPDSSVQWQAKAGLLSMTNTAENQARLAAVIASDFGGSLGTPTHWLLLTSGARLALMVDKFDRDFITGHNPVYGSCKVPMSEVFSIRTSPPEPTATLKSLEGWRLVNAPEPVLPQPGGESSPLLGKEALPFSLPLLEGGSFDLPAVKGQIVVLDFWASWCGHCIKSLPGLIETISSFPADSVKLVGVNQGESAAQVKSFMEKRGLKFTVAMDTDQSVAQKYGVDAIPHTVIVGPDGKVAWVQTGYSEDGDTEASSVVKQLLKGPAGAASHL